MPVKKTGRIRAIRLSRKLQTGMTLFIVGLIFLSLAGMAAVIYLAAGQEVSKSFFSAHRDLRNIWKGLLPLIAAAAAAFWLLASAVTILVLFRVRRSVEQSGEAVMEALARMGKGDLKVELAARSAGNLEPLAGETAKVLESFQQHVQEVKNTALELQRAVMRLNYHAFEEGEVTMSELKSFSANLTTLSRELAHSLKWFET